jgi:hypothetical protein
MLQRHASEQLCAIATLELETVSGGTSEDLGNTNNPSSEAEARRQYDDCLRPFFRQYDAWTLRGREGPEPNWSDNDMCKRQLHGNLEKLRPQ